MIFWFQLLGPLDSLTGRPPDCLSYGQFNLRRRVESWHSGDGRRCASDSGDARDVDIEYDIKAIQPLDDRGNCGVDRWGIRDVAADGQHAIWRAVGCCAPGQQMRTARMQQTRGGRPDSTGAAGDDSDEPLE